MKRFRFIVLSVLLLTMASVPPAAEAAGGLRLIVRVQGGLPVLQSLCKLLRCTVNHGLGDPDGQVFLVTLPVSLLQNVLKSTLQLSLGVISVASSMCKATCFRDPRLNRRFRPRSTIPLRSTTSERPCDADT